VQIHYVPDDLLQQVLKGDKLTKRIRQTNQKVIIYYYFTRFISFATNVYFQPANIEILLQYMCIFS
jgi:hypothetical protein